MLKLYVSMRQPFGYAQDYALRLFETNPLNTTGKVKSISWMQSDVMSRVVPNVVAGFIARNVKLIIAGTTLACISSEGNSFQKDLELEHSKNIVVQ